MYAGSHPAGIMLNFRLLFCRAVLKLSGEKQPRGCMRDRNPAGIVLNFRLLFCRAVLELSGKKQTIVMYAGSHPAGIMLNFRLLFCRAVLELSGKKTAKRKYAGSQSHGSCACGSLFDLSSGFKENLALSKNNLTILAILIEES
ncbi:hypothetical protein IV87_GL001716 [Pediococcus ethanolidurans]|uniref:Uncharacterized protein n=1 Tax=Pediococcus ethanolidurans TaxID=319653 RepID=A0A0R2K0E0_9LACO|nr:hypothetical protein IV87_GL001716 [Pediococcus ethanolidurans]